jgi:uncharacterized protein YjbI with pentapeptide repeats
VAVYDIEAGERYPDEEVECLRNRWSDEMLDEVVAWINASTANELRPQWLVYVGTRGQNEWRGPDLRGIDLSGRGILAPSEDKPRAVLQGAHLEYAKLDMVDLRRADLTEAHFEHADLRSVQLQGAILGRVHLQHANLSKANLREVAMERARIWGADLSDVFLSETNFWNVKWRSAKGTKPDPNSFRGFDVRGIRYSDPLFDQWVKQANFIRRVKDNWPKGWWWWNLTCNCGRSIRRWALVCGVIAVFFGLVFCLAAEVFAYPLVRLGKDAGFARAPNPFTYFYFSVVTFTTLGFGDVRPTGLLGEILVTLEVIFGYIGLGGLISIFTTKLIPPR